MIVLLFPLQTYFLPCVFATFSFVKRYVICLLSYSFLLSSYFFFLHNGYYSNEKN
jgi:hypothetical protein